MVLASGGYSIVTGNKRMQERPIGPLVEALRANGCSIEYLKDDKCPPLKLQGGGLPGGNIELAAELSSQYVSSILMAAPFAKEYVSSGVVSVGGDIYPALRIRFSAFFLFPSSSSSLFLFMSVFSYSFPGRQRGKQRKTKRETERLTTKDIERQTTRDT